MKADDFLDAPDAESFLGADDAPAVKLPALSPRKMLGRGTAPTKAPEPAPTSVLETIPADPSAFNFAAASRLQRKVEDGAQRQQDYGTVGPIVGPDPSVSSIARGVFTDLMAGGKNARAGVSQAAADILPDSLGSKVQAQQAKKERAQADLMTAANTPNFQSDTARGIYSGLSSTVRQLPSIAAGIATRNPEVALGGMVAPMVPEEYGKYRERGASPVQALAGALGQAGTEYLTEKMPMSLLVNGMGRMGAGKFLTGMLAREVPGEQLATVVQDAIDTAVANPDKTWGDYLRARPGAAYQTLLATLTQTGVMAGANGVTRHLEQGARANELAGAINGDAQALADAPPPRSVWAPVDARVAPPVAAPVAQPLQEPEPVAPAAVPALPYDPTVRNPGAGIMVAGQDGTALPMSAEEFLQAEDTRQQARAKEMSDAEVGLTPDVQRAQANRSEVPEAPPVEPDLLKRLMDAGWKPPEKTAEPLTPNGQRAKMDDREARDAVLKDGTRVTITKEWTDRGGVRGPGYVPDEKQEAARFVAKIGDREIGSINYQPGSSAIESLVEPEFRRRGLGTILYDLAEENGADLKTRDPRKLGTVSPDALALRQYRDNRGETPTHPNMQPQDVAADLEHLYQQDIKDSIRERLGIAPKAEDVLDRKGNTEFLSFLREHGLQSDVASDIYGDNAFKANRALPRVFRKDGMALDELVHRAVERGFLSQQDVESALDNGGVNKLTELIQRQIRGDAPVSISMADDVAATRAASRVSGELQQQASAIGLDTSGMDEAQVSGALRRIDRRRAQATARREQFDAREEARLERQAIQDADHFTPEQLDALDGDWLAGDNVTLADAMMALGFDPAEIDTYAAREAENRGRAQAPGGDAREGSPRASAADEGSPALQSYSPAEVVDRQERSAQAERDEQRQNKESDQRAQADAQRGDFTLTGSDRAADANPGQDGLFSKELEPLDHGVLNIPGRTKNINAELDRYKADKARTERADAKQQAAQRRDNKAEAKRLFAEHWPAMLEKMGGKFGEKQLRETLDSMVKWEPAKFIKFAEKFQREQTERRSEPSSEQMVEAAQPDSRTSTAESLRTELRSRFGDVIDRLEKRGFLKLWDSVQQYNEAGRFSQLPADAGGVQGMYSNKTGVAHLFGDGIEPGTAIGVLLHEVGEHASMKAMLGEARYRDLVKRAYRLASDGDDIAQTALNRIPEDTPDKFYDSELLAYMIEETANRDGKASPSMRAWLRDVMAAIRAWFYQTGFAKQLERYGVKLDMTPKDIAALAERAVKWQAEQGGEPAASGEARPVFSKAPEGEAFKRWFGDSKVVDENGEPLVVYHGTRGDGPAQFNTKGDGTNGSEYGGGVYVTNAPAYAEIFGKTIMPLYVRAENIVNAGSIPGQLQGEAAKKWALENGYDAIRSRKGTFGGVNTWQLVVFSPEQVKSAIGNRGTFDPANPDIRYSKRPVSATGSNANTIASAAQTWTVAEPNTWDNVVRQMQDNKVDLKRVRAAIESQFGRVPDAADSYMQEELYHGKVAARVEKLHDDYVEPILRKIAVAGENHGVTLDDVNAYLHALHAPERNAAMAAINPNLPNNTALSGMSDADAARTLQQFQAAGKAQALASIAKDVHQLLADTRTALVADGLEEASTVQAWEAAYKNYVPLQRDIDGRPARGTGINVRGPEAKRATGSNKQAVNILANVVTQAETAAIRAEKAEVGRSLLAMANAYPNADFWKVDTPPTKPRVNPNTGLVERNAVDPLYQTADNVVMVKDYGATRFIVFDKGSERAMALAKAMKNLDIQQVPRAIQYMGKATRFMASLLTQRNPEFWFTNFARDVQGSMIQMSGTDAEGLQAKVLGNLPKAMAGVRDMVRSSGTGQWARYAQELKDAGGTTGYMQMFEDSNDRMKDLQAEVDRMQQGKADPRRLAREVLKFIDDYNDVVENGMRLAVFQAARDAGVSTARAAAIAKNITVNFNRKGNATPVVNSLYMFFNAGLQGTARLAEAIATSPKARIAVGTIATLGFIMDVVNRAIAGDDDETKRNRYDLINEFEKSKNWIVMMPGGKYVKVPLPIGINVFHNAGRLISDAVFRKDPRNAAEYGWAFASTVLDAFSPLGQFGSMGQMIAPSVLKPAVQLAENKSAFGSPVYKSAEQGFGKVDPKPAYTRHFDSTPDFWKAASKTLNDVTGGDKVKPGVANIEPDLLRFIYTTMTGGPGRALDRTVDTAQAKARGEDVTAARLPFASRFYGATDDRQKDAAYYTDLKRAQTAKAQFEYFNKNGRRDLALEVLKELGQGDASKGRQVISEYERAKKDDRVINRQLRQLAEQQDDGKDVTEKTSALKDRKRSSHRRVLSSTGGSRESDEE